MELVRYRPGEAIRWLEAGADSIRRSAQEHGKAAFRNDGTNDVKRVGRGVRDAAASLMEYGKGAWADLLHRQAEASEYVLGEDRIDIVKGSSIQTIPYDAIAKFARKGDRTTLTLERGNPIIIKPYAYIVAGKIRIPVGWTRNGQEVPFELMIEELAARCGKDAEEA